MRAFTVFVSGSRNKTLAELYDDASVFIQKEHFRWASRTSGPFSTNT
ncbi:MAG: hypothetical protein LBE85_12705 [Candidatus Accumulibacter sp.]|jgi:hypothetical protein|nr:hypothetical protein [Accumulibacter sp.]